MKIGDRHSGGLVTLDELTVLVRDEIIDTVIVAFVDLHGRLLGKRVTGPFFLDHVVGTDDRPGEGIEACDYLLTVDVDMNVLEGFDAANWDEGYGDFQGVPDLSTLRILPWLDRTAFVLCDIYDHRTHSPVDVSARQMLIAQIERARDLGLEIMVGSELEFFAYNLPYDELAQQGYANLEAHTSSWYNLDYHIFQSTKDEPLVGAIRREMYNAGLPIEFSKGEAAPGQHELNLRYSDALTMADNHTLYKNGAKEIAHNQAKSVTFMAKPHFDQPGSSCHIHSSIWSLDGEPLSAGENPAEMSPKMRHWVGGILRYSRELSLCFAPYINSYKRYQVDSWAPTAVCWSEDNRSAGLRLVGQGPALRIESRIPGADCNAYVAFAGMIAAGLAGIEQELDCGDGYQGSAYHDPDIARIPWNIAEAINLFEQSEFAEQAFGHRPHQHLLQTAKHEWRMFNEQVTPWELKRNFERI